MYILILNVNWCKLVQFGFLSEPKLNQIKVALSCLFTGDKLLFIKMNGLFQKLAYFNKPIQVLKIFILIFLNSGTF